MKFNIMLYALSVLTILLPLTYSCQTGLYTLNDSILYYSERYFSEIEEITNEDNGNLWGVNLYGPVMIVKREAKLIVTNESDNEQYLSRNGEVFTGELLDNLNIANTAIEWKGKRWTMLLWPLPENKYDRNALFMHELFHRIQPTLGFDNLGMETNSHLDEREGRIYAKLELEALKSALIVEDINLRNEHIRNALFFRVYRHKQFPDSKQNENSLELLEGIAEFTGIILSGRSHPEMILHFEKKINDFYSNPTFVRSFCYHAIPIYGYLMSQENKNWNRSITRETNLTDYIIDFYNINIPDDLRQKILALHQEYNADGIIRYEDKREIEKKQRISFYMDQFINGDILEFSFENMNISFNPQNMEPLPGHGTVYTTIRVTDNWGILEVEKSALLSPGWDKLTITKPLQIEGEKIYGDGWNLKLNSEWTVEQVSDARYIVKKK